VDKIAAEPLRFLPDPVMLPIEPLRNALYLNRMPGDPMATLPRLRQLNPLINKDVIGIATIFPNDLLKVSGHVTTDSRISFPRLGSE
jgi:hypothetical protein